MSNRPAYDQALRTLDETLGAMGTLAQEALSLALAAFSNGEGGGLEHIPEQVSQLKQLERQVEHQCMILLLRQQPVATDLRKVSTSLKVVEHLRRVGDFAEDISDILRSLDGSPLIGDSLHDDISAMAEDARSMVERAIRAFRTLDRGHANAVILDDDKVDAAFLAIRDALAKRIAAEPALVDCVLDYLMIVKYLERLGDHAVSIAEWVGFCVSGVHKDHRIV